jgi:hypothetical protein
MKNDVQIQQEVVAELDREQNIIVGTIGVEVHHVVSKYITGSSNWPAMLVTILLGKIPKWRLTGPME